MAVLKKHFLKDKTLTGKEIISVLDGLGYIFG